MKIFKCQMCGNDFESAGRHALWCPKCKKIRIAETSSKCWQRKKEKKAKAEREEKVKKSSATLNDVIKALDEYNKRHGTYLTYGQFVQKLESKVVIK